MSNGKARTQTRKVSLRGLVQALEGAERPYPVYRFAKGGVKFERPRHNPFKKHE